jgi:hypothetical protein
VSCPQCELGNPCGRACDPDDDATPVISPELRDVAEWLDRIGRGMTARQVIDGSWRRDLYRMRKGET